MPRELRRDNAEKGRIMDGGERLKTKKRELRETH